MMNICIYSYCLKILAKVIKLFFEVLLIMSKSNFLLVLCYSEVSGSRFISFMLLQ